MKIMVARHAKGLFGSGHACLYVWDENAAEFLPLAEHPTTKEKIKAKGIKFDYSGYINISSMSYQDLPSMSPIINMDFLNIETDAVIFESNIPLKDFYKKIKNSVYDKCSNYSAFNRNCVNGVIFALKIANINLNIVETSRVKHLICCFWLPTKLITPSELMKAARNHEAAVIPKNDSVLLFPDVFLTKPKP